MASLQKDIDGLDAISTPALLLFPDIVRENIDKAIRIAGDYRRLRPHVKTHKLPQVVQMHLQKGITHFKCSTTAELKMAADAGGEDLLLAYPAYGPVLDEVIALMQLYPEKRFAILCDNEAALNAAEKCARDSKTVLNIFVDIDNGMGRTGVAPGADAFSLYRKITESASLFAAGLHVYDGHIRNSDFEERKSICDAAFAPVLELQRELKRHDYAIPELVCGGTPTFPVHSLYKDRTLSPGTFTLWDFGYGDIFAELNFSYAALLATRVISKPGKDRICLDLGNKAVASEKPHPRIRLFDIGDFEVANHSEEHLVLKTERAAEIAPGYVLLAVPVHICPTVALYDQCYVVNDNRIDTVWSIVARRRMMKHYG